MQEEIGKRFGELMKQATAHKRAGNWEEALRCAGEAHAIAMASPAGGFAAEAWTKYPLYLQQAGRYDEAMRIFHQVLEAADSILAREMSHQPAFIQRGYASNLRSVVFDKMRVAAERERRNDEADAFARKATEEADAFEAFTRVRDLHRKREHQKFLESKATNRS